METTPSRKRAPVHRSSVSPGHARAGFCPEHDRGTIPNTAFASHRDNARAGGHASDTGTSVPSAHIDAGKTTTTERILYYTGRSHKIGEVTRALRRWTGWSRSRSAGSRSRRRPPPASRTDHRINIIDTPGHVDFTVEVERSLRVLDGAVALFDSVAGVEPQSRPSGARLTSTGAADRLHQQDGPRRRRLRARRADDDRPRSGAHPVPIQLPIGAEADFKGIVDLVEKKAICYKDDLGKEIDVTDIRRTSRRRGRRPRASTCSRRSPTTTTGSSRRSSRRPRSRSRISRPRSAPRRSTSS